MSHQMGVWERQAYNRGYLAGRNKAAEEMFAAGFAEGIRIGYRKTVMQMLEAMHGEVSEKIKNVVENASVPELEYIIIHMLEASSLQELENFLECAECSK